MCGYCKPFNNRSIPGLNGAITASVSFKVDPEPAYTIDVEHWEEIGKGNSIHFRKVSSTVEIPVSFCPRCGRDLRAVVE